MLLVAGGIAGFIAALFAGADDEVAVTEPMVRQAGLSRPAGPVRLLGINEAITVPRALAPNMSPEQIAGELVNDREAVVGLGADAVRLHTAVYPRIHQHIVEAEGLDRMDEWVRIVQEAELDIVVMLSPWPGNQTANFTQSYQVPDPQTYAAYLSRVVERYDGDGVDDMPGLVRPIHHWEVDNEPDLKNTNVARGSQRDYDPSQFCTPSEYAAVLVASSAAIRAADADAVVLNGGFYRPMTAAGRDYIRAVMAAPGALEAFDVMNIHVYASDPDTARMQRAIDTAREFAPGKPVWITETNVPSGGREGHLSPEFQAEMVVQVLGTALESGVERLFWHTLADPPPRGRSKGPGMREHSLLVAGPAGFVDKPAAGAWRRMADALEGLDWSQVQVLAPGQLRLGDATLLLAGRADIPGERVRVATGEVLPSEGSVDAQDGAVLVR